MSRISREELERIALAKRERMAELARDGLAQLRKNPFTQNEQNRVLNDADAILGEIGFFATYGDAHCIQLSAAFRDINSVIHQTARVMSLASVPDIATPYFRAAMSQVWRLAKPSVFTRRLKGWLSKLGGVEIERER